MSRYVRQSAFRHVHGDQGKSQSHISGAGLRATGTQISCNDKYVAVACSGGGGPVVVHEASKPGRIGKFFQVSVHKSQVEQAEFSPFASNLLATASQDAYIKLSVIPDGDLEGAEHVKKAARELQGHYKKVEHLSWHPTAENVIASGSSDHTVKFWDIEAQSEFESFGKEIQTPTCVNWNSNGSLVAVGSKGDGKMYIFDPRAEGAVSGVDGFAKKADGTSYFFADNHNMIVGVGRSARNARRWKIWDAKKLDKALEHKDLGTGSGILSPMYDADTSIVWLAGKGDSNISYWEISKGSMHFLTQFQDTKPHKKVAWAPKRSLNVKTCEIAKAYRLLANGANSAVVPVSFQVPRKSDLFQKDLYPDTFAGVPGCSSDDWKSGTDGEIKKQSMKPGAEVAERTTTKLAAKRSASDYEAEIAKLKAEVERLKVKAGEA